MILYSAIINVRLLTDRCLTFFLFLGTKELMKWKMPTAAIEMRMSISADT